MKVPPLTDNKACLAKGFFAEKVLLTLPPILEPWRVFCRTAECLATICLRGIYCAHATFQTCVLPIMRLQTSLLTTPVYTVGSEVTPKICRC